MCSICIEEEKYMSVCDGVLIICFVVGIAVVLHEIEQVMNEWR